MMAFAGKSMDMHIMLSKKRLKKTKAACFLSDVEDNSKI
jgi:hypothetical protein